jgi:alkyl sulfatase BDS1-like metallo-beta-lactamase superfamily hydrolase
MFAGFTPAEISRRGRELAMAGITGVREGPTNRDPETVALLFDTMRLQVNPEHGISRPTTFQWEFTDPDIPTWHLTVNNGSSSVAEGEAPKPNLRLRIAYQDMVDIIGNRLDPRRALLSGHLRLRGNPLALRKLTRVFPRD